ncbi:ABC transporter permease [Streptomyces sp. NBC_00464]|uniref:ABC transporter permease n=1 Tax=Streptomyces sp. NBC_00464 TaxID=2975751 RepID=UPI002E19B572
MKSAILTRRSAILTDVGAVVERNYLVSRKNWSTLLSGMIEPILFLLSIGLGLGSLLGPVKVGDETVPYLAYFAPALMATSAMNGALYDSTVNFFWKLRYRRLYKQLLSAPMNIEGIVVGEIIWAQIRGAVYAVVMLVVIGICGGLRSPWAVLTVPAALLVGFAFAAIGVAISTVMRSWQDLDPVRFGTLVLFLASGTFFPASAYPAAIGYLVKVSPLYASNELIRALCLGRVGVAQLLEVAYLVALTVVALWIAVRRFGRLNAD